MIVNLKLSADKIGYLNSCLSTAAVIDVAGFVRADRQKKVVLSLLAGVAEKLEKKFKEVSKNPNLFDAKKKYKVSLDYHDAFAINTVLFGLTKTEKDAWRKATAISLHLLIDEKL